jgi:hypothetical protein
MITEAQYKQAQQVIKQYKLQLKNAKPKVCKHYNIDFSVEEQRYVCLCGFKGPVYVKK